jgi:hypothetical protein
VVRDGEAYPGAPRCLRRTGQRRPQPHRARGRRPARTLEVRRILILSLGWALAFRSALGVPVVAATLFPLTARMNAEEKLLAQHFGNEYEMYRARTWRLVPGLY